MDIVGKMKISPFSLNIYTLINSLIASSDILLK